MIWGATVPLIYHAFICDPDLRARYLTVTCSAALFCTFLNFQPSFSKARLQPFRILGFGFLSLSFFIPVIHSLAACGLAVQTRRLALQWIVYTLICHTFCAAAFATDVSTPANDGLEDIVRMLTRCWYDSFPRSSSLAPLISLARATRYPTLCFLPRRSPIHLRSRSNSTSYMALLLRARSCSHCTAETCLLTRCSALVFKLETTSKHENRINGQEGTRVRPEDDRLHTLTG